MNRNRYLTATPCSIRLSYDTIERIKLLSNASGITMSEWIRRRIEGDLNSDDKMVLITKLFELLGVKDIKTMAKIMDFHKKQIINNDEGDKKYE